MLQIQREIPKDTKHLLNLEDYNLFIEFSLDFLYPKYNEIKLVDGVFSVRNDEKESYHFINFDSLIRSILPFERSEWKDEIENYLYRTTYSEDSELEKHLQNFFVAENKLTLRLHHKDAYGYQIDYGTQKIDNPIDNYPYQIDFPELYTMLALEMPNQFHILKNEQLKYWEKGTGELFKIAERNLIDLNENLNINEYVKDDISIITIFDGDFSAAYVTNFGESCSNCIGKLGTFVGIPNRGSAFISILNEVKQVLPSFNELIQRINQFFDEDPGPITRNLYWYFNGKFEICPMKCNDDGTLTYDFPKKLLELIS